jgi:hypothetical protein
MESSLFANRGGEFCAANMIDGPLPSSASVITLASGIGEELNRLLEAERLMEGRKPGGLLFGEASSPVSITDGFSREDDVSST